MTRQIGIENSNVSETFKYTGPILDVNVDFKYFMDSFLAGDEYWDVNNSHDITEADRELFRTLMNSKFDEIYFMQRGEPDGDAWLLLAKIHDTYICFEASCDYTGFDCRGGGTFGYSIDWPTVWNKYCSQIFRETVAKHHGYDIGVQIKM